MFSINTQAMLRSAQTIRQAGLKFQTIRALSTKPQSTTPVDNLLKNNILHKDRNHIALGLLANQLSQKKLEKIEQSISLKYSGRIALASLPVTVLLGYLTGDMPNVSLLCGASAIVSFTSLLAVGDSIVSKQVLNKQIAQLEETLKEKEELDKESSN